MGKAAALSPRCAAKYPRRTVEPAGRPPAYSFPRSAIVTATERDFLHLHTPLAVLGMIKDGSYDARLAGFLNAGDPPAEDGGGGFVLRELFPKDLTQSDVGKRKGLVVPKRDAEEFFPDVRAREGGSARLRLVDRRTRRWVEFKYCFYRSSQCYVLTTGWCKFVKDNCLKEKDLVKFYELAKEGGGDEERYIMIDIERFREEDAHQGGAKQTRTREEVAVARKRRHESCEEGEERVKRTIQGRKEVVEIVEKETYNNAENGVRLFGVVIG